VARSAYEIVLPSNKVVVLAELKSGQLVRAMGVAGGANSSADEMAVALEGLRLSLREIDGKQVKYDDVVGDFLDDLFGMTDLMLLVQAWQSIHYPKREVSTSVLGKMVARSS
jgi:hypothetical protein